MLQRRKNAGIRTLKGPLPLKWEKIDESDRNGTRITDPEWVNSRNT